MKGPYRFCHLANRDALLDAYQQLPRQRLASYFPYGQFEAFRGISLQQVAQALGGEPGKSAAQLVVVKLKFDDVEGRQSMRGTPVALKERACRAWPYRFAAESVPQVDLPDGSIRHTDQFLIALTSLPHGRGSALVLIGVWMIHCHSDENRRSFGLDDVDQQVRANLLGSWLDSDDDQTYACIDFLATKKNQKGRAYYWPTEV